MVNFAGALRWVSNLFVLVCLSSSFSSQPTLEVIKNLAVALGVTTDSLIFEDEERGPSDELRLQFERISRFDEDEKKVVKALLEGLILKHEAKQLSQISG